MMPSIPSLIEQLALREEKVMRHQLSTEMLPPATVGYVVNKPPPDPDRVDRPLNRPPVSTNNEVKMLMKSAGEVYSLIANKRTLLFTIINLFPMMFSYLFSPSNFPLEESLPATSFKLFTTCLEFSKRPITIPQYSSFVSIRGRLLTIRSISSLFIDTVRTLRIENEDNVGRPQVTFIWGYVR